MMTVMIDAIVMKTQSPIIQYTRRPPRMNAMLAMNENDDVVNNRKEEEEDEDEDNDHIEQTSIVHQPTQQHYLCIDFINADLCMKMSHIIINSEEETLNHQQTSQQVIESARKG